MSTPTHREALLDEAAEIAMGHPSKDARAFACSVTEYLLSRPEPQAGEAVAWSYVPSAVWKETVLTNDPAKAQLAREMGCLVTDLFTHPQEALEKAFAAGWRTAANWMNRDDLVADIGSPAYMKDRDAALSAEQKVAK